MVSRSLRAWRTDPPRNRIPNLDIFSGAWRKSPRPPLAPSPIVDIDRPMRPKKPRKITADSRKFRGVSTRLDADTELRLDRLALLLSPDADQRLTRGEAAKRALLVGLDVLERGTRRA